MQASDRPAVLVLKNEEGWNQTSEDLRFILEHNPDYCWVATIDDKVIGSVTAMDYQNKLAWIGMMLVHKDFRGQGIATQLLKTALLAARDCSSIKLDATPAGKELYVRCGFVPEYELCRMTIRHIPEQSKKVIGDEKPELITMTNLPDVVKSDRVRFGADRTSVLSHLLRQSEAAFLLRNSTGIKGYIFSRPGTRYLQIGPLMADSTSTAKVLLSTVFSEVKSQLVVLDILADKQELRTWLDEMGFQEERQLLRMYLKDNYSGTIAQQYLIAGPELG